MRSKPLFSARINKLLLCTAAVAILSGCAIFEKKDSDEESNWLIQQFEKDGESYANKATLAYSKGDFKQTLTLVTEALKDNPRNQRALLVGALSAEKLGRYNRARQYYEDLILIDGQATSILGSSSGQPEKIADIAKTRLRSITIKQSELVIENNNGTRSFNVSKNAGQDISRNTINNALKRRSATIGAALQKPAPAIDNLFNHQEQNIISRFLVMKELAEKDFISKEEFLSRRNANIGGLLPLTKQAPGVGIDQPVPSPDLIVERINVLKEGVEARAITPREFSAEREIIVEALMSPNPRARLKPKAPSKDILGAAKDLRKLEVLYDLNLITSGEKAAEKKAIEKYLGINREAPKPATPAVQTAAPVAMQTVPTQPQTLQPELVEVTTTVEETPIPLKPEVNTVTKGDKSMAIVATTEPTAKDNAPQNIVPNVTSPF